MSDGMRLAQQDDGGLFLHNLPSLVAAAHELKSPLALIRQVSLTLEDASLTPEDRLRLVQRITLSSERALRLTSDLTRAARLQDALFSLEPINPQQLCEDVVQELEPLFRAHQRQIRLSKRRHPLLLVGNRELLRRIVLNFGDNALHYSGEDAAIELQIKALNHGSTIRLGVRDYGPALSSDMWKTLQAKLQRAPQPVHARPQSSGLGLFIASQFAEAMGGKIGVTRHRDGCTFYVDLTASRQLRLI